MANMSRSAFEAELQRLGHGESEPDKSFSCPHPAKTSAVFHVPEPEYVDGARTYGDLGWLRFLGCVDCCRDLAGVLACGGCYSNVRVFNGEVDVTSAQFGPTAPQPAEQPLPDDDEE